MLRDFKAIHEYNSILPTLYWSHGMIHKIFAIWKSQTFSQNAIYERYSRNYQIEFTDCAVNQPIDHVPEIINSQPAVSFSHRNSFSTSIRLKTRPIIPSFLKLANQSFIANKPLIIHTLDYKEDEECVVYKRSSKHGSLMSSSVSLDSFPIHISESYLLQKEYN